jgi:hypothetical protein
VTVGHHEMRLSAHWSDLVVLRALGIADINVSCAFQFRLGLLVKGMHS